MTVTQTEKAKQFRALHEASDAFVIANVWDGGSARMMAGLGFKALATSSGASAGLLGRRDGHVTRDEAMAHIETVEHEPNAVIEEHQAGYSLSERLLRPALVTVAKAPGPKEPEPDANLAKGKGHG